MEKPRFELLARLLRSKEPVSQAARLVLVHGLKPSDAAREAEALPQSLSRALKSFRKLDADIAKVYAGEKRN